MRKPLILIAVLLVVFTGVYIYLRENKLRDFEPDIKRKLNELVQQASHGLYHLEIERLETDVINSRITLINAHLRPDTNVYAELEKVQKAPNDLFDIQVSHLTIDDIARGELIRNKAIDLRRLHINKPVIRVWHKKQPYLLPEDTGKTIFQHIQHELKNVKVDTIILNDVDLIYKNISHNKETRLLNVKLFFEDVLIDSPTQFDRQRFLFAKSCRISLKDYGLNTSDSLYRFTVGDLAINTATKTMEFKNVGFKPRVTIRQFYKAVKTQKDRFDVTIDEVEFRDIEWWPLLAEEAFFAEKLVMKNGSISVYNDKSMPVDKKSKVGKYPHQLVRKLPFEMKVDSVVLNNFTVKYTELNPKSNQTGTILFGNVEGTILNVTNIREQIRKSPVCTVIAQAKFLDKAPLTARFNLDLANAASGDFTVTATLGRIDAATLNKITKPLGLLEIERVDVKSLNVSIAGNDYHASGTVKLLYDDLKISALEKGEDGLEKRGLLSFFANHFVLKTSNPLNGQPVRIEKPHYTRDTRRSFFNLIWKTIFTGTGKTVGFKPKKGTI